MLEGTAHLVGRGREECHAIWQQDLAQAPDSHPVDFLADAEQEEFLRRRAALCRGAGLPLRRRKTLHVLPFRFWLLPGTSA